MSKSLEKPKKYEDRLMAVFDFDDDDVEANQFGQISEHQLDHLKAARRPLAGYWIAGIVFSAIFVALGLITATTLVALIGAAMMVGFSFYFGKSIQRVNQDIREQHVAQVEGRADLSLKKKQNDNDYFMRVDDVRFPLKQSAFLAFKNGDPYRIYYTPRSKHILAVEWLRDGDDNLRDPDEIDADSSSPTLTKEDQPSRLSNRP